MDLNKSLPMLSDVELRVLGSLIEKSKTTPDYYPMTINAITAACNQKTSRKPVVNYDEETVMSAINNLKGQSLVSTAVGGSIRSVKYKHNFTTLYPVSPAELAVLCLLFLRGPQTPGELNTNSARLYEFHSLEEVHEVLEKLIHSDIPFVKELPKRPGQKETRYIHLLGEHIEQEEEAYEDTTSISLNNVNERLTNAEAEIAKLKETVDRLMKELIG